MQEFDFFLSFSAFKLHVWLAYKGNKNHVVKKSPNFARRILI